jgi:hypothetical protein
LKKSIMLSWDPPTAKLGDPIGMKFYTEILKEILGDLIVAIFSNFEPEILNQKLAPFGAVAPPGKIAPSFFLSQIMAICIPSESPTSEQPKKRPNILFRLKKSCFRAEK